MHIDDKFAYYLLRRFLLDLEARRTDIVAVVSK